MKMILQSWNFMRIIRLVLGVIILIQGFFSKDISTIILGVVFAAMPVFNIGCCGTSGCAVNPARTIKNKTKSIPYEEVDSIK